MYLVQTSFRVGKFPGFRGFSRGRPMTGTLTQKQIRDVAAYVVEDING